MKVQRRANPSLGPPIFSQTAVIVVFWFGLASRARDAASVCTFVLEPCMYVLKWINFVFQIHITHNSGLSKK